nr:hypothetical protein [Allomuricauda sp.]
MKKIYISFCLGFFSIALFGQERHQLEVATLGGYEYNYFKSPTMIRTDEGLLTEEDLISSSFYQDVTVDYGFRYKWGADRIRFYALPYARIFQENMDDSYWSIDSKVKYDHKFNRKTRFFAGLNFKRMNREGLDGAQDVLVNPLGYTLLGSELELERANSKNVTGRIGLFHNFKNFDAFGTRDLEYHEFGSQLKLEKEFENQDLEHTLGFLAYYKVRLYNTFNASEISSEGNRDWRYIRATAYYEYPVSKSIRLKPSVTYYQRMDPLANRSGFRQYGPSLGLYVKTKRTRIRSQIEYLKRDYTDILARDNEGPLQENVAYQYTDFSLRFEHQLSHSSFSLTGNVYSRLRTTNYSDLAARSFRGYRNQYAGIGIKWEL